MADSCTLAELERLGRKYRIALRIARDERWERLKCDHKGVYADDCIIDRIMKHKIYIVATNDRDLKRRIRKVPGVPIMSVARGKYVIERLPGVLMTVLCVHFTTNLTPYYRRPGEVNSQTKCKNPPQRRTLPGRGSFAV